MDKKILVLAYPGTGKTYIADNYADVSDIEFQHYRYDYGEYSNLPLEKLKGRTDIRTQKKEWPNNFFKFLEEELEKTKCVFVPMSTSIFPILDYLANEKNVRIIFAIQSEDSLSSMTKTYKQRGNSEEFIERRKNDFIKFHNLIKEFNFEKVYIQQNEFLIDALNKLGIKFKKGTGFKNYL